MDTIPLLSNYKLYKNNRSFNKKITYFLYNSDSNNQEIYKFVNKLKNYSKKNQIIVESYDLTSYFKQFIIQTIENIYNRIKSLL